MPPPEFIPIRYTEEEAGYVTVRPVVRQTFRFNDLLDMVLGVTGKQPDRIRQILRSGSVSFRSYRYTWDGFEITEQELNAPLARFPDADPSRAFPPHACTAALLETGGARPGHIMELTRSNASRKRLFRGSSFWDVLMETAARNALGYEGYSYLRRGDLYRLDVADELLASLAQAAGALAPRDLRRDLRALDRASRIVFVCPREVS
jgi:hypothetical protein